ncbi:MAG: iron-containing alcohol dehydrogenase [Fusobacteriaceae bacterium]|nr:iron-containing alcohol dehydrogenase [Fusobacteriaceae bacterium]MBN2837765.1 iron-containing alcohol dehydrogenase [Fusobacteriaceae bacterium]
MLRTFTSVSKYIQGINQINNLSKYINIYGRKAGILISSEDKERFSEKIEKSLKDVDFDYIIFDIFPCENHLLLLSKKLVLSKIEIIVGIGGGRSLDSAKALAYYLNLPIIIIPTIASTDGACSSLVALYSNEGIFKKYLKLKSSPNIVLVDTQIILNAPKKFFIAGIGDAISTYFEGQVYIKGNTGKTSVLGRAVAKLCYETIINNYEGALKGFDFKESNEEFENLVEANILLSCIGFENTGLSLAHSISNGLTKFEEGRKFMHGELVAFGTLVQLKIEENKEFYKVHNLIKNLNLPDSFNFLSFTDIMKIDKLCDYILEETQVKKTFKNLEKETLLETFRYFIN